MTHVRVTSFSCTHSNRFLGLHPVYYISATLPSCFITRVNRLIVYLLLPTRQASSPLTFPFVYKGKEGDARRLGYLSFLSLYTLPRVIPSLYILPSYCSNNIPAVLLIMSRLYRGLHIKLLSGGCYCRMVVR